MIPLLGFIIDAMVLWFVTVFVSQEHKLDWRQFIFWIFIASFGRGVTMIPIIMLEKDLSAVAISLINLASMGVYLAIMFYALHSKFLVTKLRDKAIIILIFIAYKFVISLIL